MQYLTIDEVADHRNLVIASALGLFNRMIRQFHSKIAEIQEKEISKSIPLVTTSDEKMPIFKPVPISLEKDLENAAEVIRTNYSTVTLHFLLF